MRDIRMNLLEDEMTYRTGFLRHTLSYSDIVQAYTKLEEVHIKSGCGVISYNVEFLYLKTKSEEVIKLETSSPEKAKELLQFLKEKNENIVIGQNAD